MTTFTEKVEEIFVELLSYLPYSEDSSIEAEAQSIAQKSLIEAHQAEISRMLERVEKEVIGDDELSMLVQPMILNPKYPTPVEEIEKHSQRVEQYQKVYERDKLRYEQRQAINKIKGEYK